MGNIKNEKKKILKKGEHTDLWSSNNHIAYWGLRKEIFGDDRCNRE